MEKLPKEGRSQEIGRLAGRALSIKLPKSWIETPLAGDTDFGIDYLVQLKSHENYVKYSFYLQLKGTTRPAYVEDNTYISFNFDVSNLNNYRQQECLVMVALVDLSKNEDKLEDCPIFYFWLEEEWFVINEDKLELQSTIAIKIPVSNILNTSLDIYQYYSNRILEKLAVDELKKRIQIPNRTSVESIELLTNAIAEKPLILKSMDQQSEAPWIDNPKGEASTDLKTCSDYISNNRIQNAKEILNQLNLKKEQFSENELAEFYYQKGNVLSCEGFFDEAETYFELAMRACLKSRYRLAYLESKFKLDSRPSDSELEEFIKVLNEHNLQECSLKAKSLTILRRAPEALQMLRENHPNEIMIQMVVCTMGELYDDLDRIIAKNIACEFEEEREIYLFNSLAARRYFHKSTKQTGIHGEILNIYGHLDYDIDGMKKSQYLIQKAWASAKKLGYPSDVTTLIDISCLVYGYFNNYPELLKYIEEIYLERPNNIEVLRPYTRILFNSKRYKKVIKLLEMLDVLDSDECGMKILSYFYNGEMGQSLEFIKLYENTLLNSLGENTPIIFCIGIQIAELIFQNGLAERYKGIVKSLPNGEAFLAIQEFISKSNQDQTRHNEFAQELYEVYLRLDKSYVIAEQLLPYLNSCNKEIARQVIELSEHILSIRELSKNEYLCLAQAFFTTERWGEAEKLAQRNIVKGIAVSRWKLVQAAALHNLGEVGIAYKRILEVMSSEDTGKEEQQFFIELSLSLGLIDDVVDFLEGHLANSIDVKNTIVTIRKLIEIYINRLEYKEKLKIAILKYGDLIDQNDCDQEGDYLQLCIICSPFESVDQINAYKERSNKYFKTFPNSTILRRANINIEDGGEALLASLKQLAGITPEVEEIWERNKQKLRSRELPIPFFMRGDFLQDTRDVYTTWRFSKCSKDEELEFKIIHAPQMEKEKFIELIDISHNILFEETTLLILNDLKLLDRFLNIIPQFSIMNSVFKKINLTTHEPMSINRHVSGLILKSIQNNIGKLKLINEKKDDDIFIYNIDIGDKNTLLLTDDLYVSSLINSFNKNILCGNIFNILEFLYHKNILGEDEYYEKIGECFEFGIVEIGYRNDFLAKCVEYYLIKPNVYDYTDTGFERIYNKILADKGSFQLKHELFLDMFLNIDISDLSPAVLISLIMKILENTPEVKPQKIVDTWFLYLGLKSKLVIDRNGSISKVHADLWLKYKQVIEKLDSRTPSSKSLLNNILKVIKQLDSNVGESAFNNLKFSFSSDSKEYIYLDNIKQ